MFYTKADKKQLGSRCSLPDQSYLPLLQDVDFSPIFILGHARSGTTLLYRLLAETQCFNFFNAYHIVKYNELLFNYVNGQEDSARQELDALYKSLGVSNRIFDDVEVSSDYPEEYGFVHEHAESENTPPNKDILFKNLKKLLRRQRTALLFDSLQLDSEKLPLFIESCKKIQFISDPDRPLLLKNPWDFPNFIYLKEAFPKAKFIFIHRHPVSVINSQLKALRSILSTKSPYVATQSRMYVQLFNNPILLSILRMLVFSPMLSNLRSQLLTMNLAHRATYFMDNIHLLPDTDYICIKYEDICKEPQTLMPAIFQFLGVSPSLNTNYSTLVRPRPLRLLPEIAHNYNYICENLQSYLIYQAYNAITEEKFYSPDAVGNTLL